MQFHKHIKMNKECIQSCHWFVEIFHVHEITRLAEVLNLCSPGPGNVSFSLNGITYQNNSLVTLEDIGGALLCVIDQTGCCRSPYTGAMGPVRGNWYFPNGTRVPSVGSQWDFYRTRGDMVVTLNRRRGGVDGVYLCEIPDAMDITQKIYIGVYTANAGEWYTDLQCQKMYV